MVSPSHPAGCCSFASTASGVPHSLGLSPDLEGSTHWRFFDASALNCCCRCRTRFDIYSPFFAVPLIYMSPSAPKNTRSSSTYPQQYDQDPHLQEHQTRMSRLHTVTTFFFNDRRDFEDYIEVLLSSYQDSHGPSWPINTATKQKHSVTRVGQDSSHMFPDRTVIVGRWKWKLESQIPYS